MLKINTVKTIDSNDWDAFVQENYGKPYCFQQQNGCKDRGTEYFIATTTETEDPFEGRSIPEVVNHDEMGVPFEVWLARDPKQGLAGDPSSNHHNSEPTDRPWEINLWWERNFYPDVEMIANDLCRKEILPPGEYRIIIDW